MITLELRNLRLKESLNKSGAGATAALRDGCAKGNEGNGRSPEVPRSSLRANDLRYSPISGNYCLLIFERNPFAKRYIENWLEKFY